MLNEWLTGGLEEHFFAQTRGHRPFSRPSVADADTTRATWDVLRDLVEAGNELDGLVVRNGRLLQDSAPASWRETKALLMNGCSIVLRKVERHNQALADLAHDFEQRLGGTAVVQLFATPPGHYSFGWHYDAEEVFIVQTEGVKEYYLRENTVNPHPRIDNIPRDMQFERETTPMMGCTLVRGDWLYIPSGWWHRALAQKPALSISVGVLPPRHAASPLWEDSATRAAR